MELAGGSLCLGGQRLVFAVGAFFVAHGCRATARSMLLGTVDGSGVKAGRCGAGCAFPPGAVVRSSYPEVKRCSFL